MKQRILVVLVALAMALAMSVGPAFAHPSHSGGFHQSGPWCHYTGHGYKLVYGKGHWRHGDSRAIYNRCPTNHYPYPAPYWW